MSDEGLAVGDRTHRPPREKQTLREACRARGVRMTRQREVIVELLDTSQEHLDARTLLEEARRRLPGIDKTTVYRTIRRLRKLGLIDELDLLHMGEHEGHFYETLPEKMHLHIVCMACGKVMEVMPPSWAAVEAEVEKESQFTIEMTRVEMGGWCRECRQAGKGLG